MACNNAVHKYIEYACEFLDRQGTVPGAMLLDKYPPVYSGVVVDSGDLAELLGHVVELALRDTALRAQSAVRTDGVGSTPPGEATDGGRDDV